MVNVQEALLIIADLNDLAPADSFGNHKPENPEYFRGQIELLKNLMGYTDDGYNTEQYLKSELGVRD